ncbi:hypothetical protein GCM10020369_71330 [Cryptosporangium minutisporangium]|uniref:Isochorismatase-like domain-containing protein n=2 Tax=Cryptosporangium minutisporangium TaxID=113569 RepID=A0ABP6T8R2_9ACTN
MPTAAELTEGPAGWRPDPARAALLVHDMQGYFLDFFPPGQSPTTELLTNVRRLKDAARTLGMPVIHTAQPGRMTPAARGLLQDLWGPGMTDDPRATDIVPAVAPAPSDTVLTKYRYSAFHRTTLAADLAVAGRDQLVVCGVFAHIGCLLTAADAYANDVQPFLVADAVADFSAEEHRMALWYAARRCAATPTTDQVLSALEVTP